jgi:hypothetical protein
MSPKRAVGPRGSDRRLATHGVFWRIREALELCCRILLPTTGEEAEVDHQHSYKNIVRTGFSSRLHTREFCTSWRVESSVLLSIPYSLLSPN